MKNHALILCIITFLTMSFCAALTPLPAQSQKISIEKSQLVELTKKAEKGALYESENTNLIVQNYKLKEANTKLSKDISDLEQLSETYRKQRNQNRWALAGLLGAVVTSLFFRIKKHLR